jgi:hypothetical protein
MSKGISLIAVHKAFGTEESCIAFLKAARWPEGVRCVRCDCPKVSEFVTNETVREITDDQGSVVETKRVPARHLFQCNNEDCRFQFSATAGTIFDKSHLPLSTWFQAVAILVNAKKSISAKQMERDLGVNYRTAWFLNHRLREAMQSENGLFGGEVEIDGTYIGGKYGVRRKHATYDKQPVMGPVKRGTVRQHSHVQAFLVSEEAGTVVDKALTERVSPGAELYTDDHAA